jgi:hypothetical protein
MISTVESLWQIWIFQNYEDMVAASLEIFGQGIWRDGMLGCISS